MCGKDPSFAVGGQPAPNRRMIPHEGEPFANDQEARFDSINQNPKRLEISTKKRSLNFLDNHDLNSPEPSPEITDKDFDNKKLSNKNGKFFYN